MSRSTIARFLNPWRYRREQEERRLRALRERDGDGCARCRRPMRFDLPAGHALAAKVEAILPATAGGTGTLDNLCLCHGRCNAKAGDDTGAVTERVRRKAEAELFSRARSRRTA